MRRLAVIATALVSLAAAVQPHEADAGAAALFGTAETRAGSYATLPQWRRVMRGIAQEEPAVRACEADPARCPNRATMAWLALLRRLEGAPRRRQLEAVNSFVNRSAYVTDAANYGLRDYWATPLEFLSRSGDCEDYAIAKYQSLRRLGLSAAALRLVVVQDVIRDLPHAVLAVYLDGEIYILDNLSDAVLDKSRVTNYVPYYSVNEITRWAHTAPNSLVAGDGTASIQPARP